VPLFFLRIAALVVVLEDAGARAFLQPQAMRTMYIDKATLGAALQELYGTAGHLLKIWFTLKHMGLSQEGNGVEIDTSNSTPSLERLYSFGAPDGSFYIPFAHTSRYLTMKHDASRSIIQTNIQRWASSGSVVTCDPTDFLNFKSETGVRIRVEPSRRYPFGLGKDQSGFALEDGARVAIPITAFAVWFGRKTSIPLKQEPSHFLRDTMLSELNISPSERELIFVDDELKISTRSTQLTNADIYASCAPFIEGDAQPTAELWREDFSEYARRVRGMVSSLNVPSWMRTSPEQELMDALKSGAKALLLYGPPRTGKTRAIDATIARDNPKRCSIQIHDGWGYDNLVQGFRPDEKGNWSWHSGPLKSAVESKKEFIVLEEINRTVISQAMGEVFSLIEEAYRGKAHSLTLRNGEPFWIPPEIVFLMTMNTVDKSTEEVDDALIGRVTAIEFSPRPEDLNAMLSANQVSEQVRQKLAQLFGEILSVYPLGHGYFAGLSGTANSNGIVTYYKARIRPVLVNFLGEIGRQDLAKIDNLVDELFGKTS